MSQSILAISYFFHLIATVVWLGGLLLLAGLALPGMRRLLHEQPALSALTLKWRKRYFVWANFSLVVLIVTGLTQMAGDPNYDGVLQFTNEWSRAILLKHIAIAGMVICGLVLQMSVLPALERVLLLIERGKGDADANSVELERLRARESRLTWVSVALGALTLAFTAWATAI